MDTVFLISLYRPQISNRDLLPSNYLLCQKNNFTTEESESSGDEKKQEITSNFKEESTVMRNFLQKSQKPSRSEIPIKR